MTDKTKKPTLTLPGLPGAEPIHPEHDPQLHAALASTIDALFNGENCPQDQKRVGFVLLTANFGDIAEGRVNYVSNGARDDMVSMLREFLARAEGRYVGDAPETKQ